MSILRHLYERVVYGPAPPDDRLLPDGPSGELLAAPSTTAKAPATPSRNTKSNPNGDIWERDFRAGRVQRSDWTPEAAVRQGLKVCSWVYTCVTRRAQFAGSIPLKLQVRQGGRWVDSDDDHPLIRLLGETPNIDASREDYIEAVSMDLDLAGEFYSRIALGTGRVQIEPVALWPFRAFDIEPVIDEGLGIVGFAKRGRTQRRWSRTSGGSVVPDLDREEVVFGKLRDPANPYRGLAPLKALAWAVDTDVDASRANRYVLANAARPSSVLAVEGSLTPEIRTALEKQINEKVAGVENAGKVALLGAKDAKLLRLGVSIDELMTLGLRGMTREEICAVYGVPPVIAGLWDKATYSNAKEAKRLFWMLTVLPLLRRILAQHYRAFRPWWGDDVRLVPDVADVPELHDLEPERVDAAVKLLKEGLDFERVNKRLRLGFDPRDGDAVAWVRTNLRPASVLADTPVHSSSAAASTDDAAGDEGDEDGEDRSTLPNSQPGLTVLPGGALCPTP